MVKEDKVILIEVAVIVETFKDADDKTVGPIAKDSLEMLRPPMLNGGEKFEIPVMLVLPITTPPTDIVDGTKIVSVAILTPPILNGGLRLERPDKFETPAREVLPILIPPTLIDVGTKIVVDDSMIPPILENDGALSAPVKVDALTLKDVISTPPIVAEDGVESVPVIERFGS